MLLIYRFATRFALFDLLQFLAWNRVLLVAGPAMVPVGEAGLAVVAVVHMDHLTWKTDLVLQVAIPPASFRSIVVGTLRGRVLL